MDASRFDLFTRRLGGRTSRRTAVGTALGGLALAGFNRIASGQDATPVPVDTSTDAEKPVFMFVQTFASGRGDFNPGAGTPLASGAPTVSGGASFLLTLEGHTGQRIYFSDRPDRIIGASPTAEFTGGLGFGVENPPNAALVAEFKTGQGVVVLQLIEPSYDVENGTITYGAEVLASYEGMNMTPVMTDQVAERLPAEFGPAALFIDDCPDIKSCVRTLAEAVITCGPIPDGPYGQCWQGLFKGGCEPCWEWETWEYLNGLCHDAYGPNCYAF